MSFLNFSVGPRKEQRQAGRGRGRSRDRQGEAGEASSSPRHIQAVPEDTRGCAPLYGNLAAAARRTCWGAG